MLKNFVDFGHLMRNAPTGREQGEGANMKTLTLPSLRAGSLPLPQCGRGAYRFSAA